MLLFLLHAHISRHHKIDRDSIRLVIDKKTYLIRPDEIVSIADAMNFLITELEEKNSYQVKPAIIRNPLPAIEIGGRVLNGPSDAMSDITYEQFIMLQTYHEQMQRNPEYIDHLIAVIYYSGKSYDLAAIEQQAKSITRLSVQDKTIILWFYISCLDYLSFKFERVFSGSGDSSNLSVFESQMKVVNSLAGGDMTKKPAVREGLLYDALISMEESIRLQDDLDNN